VLRHANWEAFLHKAKPDPDRMFAMTTKGSSTAHDMRFQPGDWFVFGSETSGLPADIREGIPLAQRLRLPMRADQRSLNLSNSVAVITYEAWRQNGFVGKA
jgi:tRNA (cytidine/uridine-2'-O-)-methyltransferase